MNDRNKIKLPKKVNHYPVDTHLSKCCLRECPMKNVKGKVVNLLPGYGFIEAEDRRSIFFHFSVLKGKKIQLGHLLFLL